MTLSLPDRIAQQIADEGRPMTAQEIALALHVRLQDVRESLASDRRFALTLPGRRSPRAKLYVVLAAEAVRERSGQSEVAA